MARAESIQTVEKNTAVTRAKALMWFIDRKLVNLDEKSHLVEFQDNLRSVPFLPILPRPDHFPIIWKGKDLLQVYLKLIKISVSFWKHSDEIQSNNCCNTCRNQFIKIISCNWRCHDKKKSFSLSVLSFVKFCNCR